MELEDTRMTFFDAIWPTDDSTRVQMEKKIVSNVTSLLLTVQNLISVFFIQK